MSVLNRITRFFGKDATMEVYDSQTFGNIENTLKLTDENCFDLVIAVPELFFPVDFFADRISKLDYSIVDNNGNVLDNYTKRLKDLNPLYSFKDLVYKYVFSLYGYGNAITYIHTSDSFARNTFDSITRLDVLTPSLTEIKEFNTINELFISDLNEAIQEVRYYNNAQRYKVIKKENVNVCGVGYKKQADSLILDKSMLFIAEKAINILLSVYSARLNIYKNNGMAGILTKKTVPASSDIASIGINGNNREDIVKDINSKYGIVGRKNLWGISGVPVEFINTLASIRELMPLEETLELSIKIASIFQIPSQLVPRKDNSTFDNQASAERGVWSNALIPALQTVEDNLTTILKLPIGTKLKGDLSNIEALQENESEKEDFVTKKLANLEKLKALSPESKEIEIEIQKIIKDYGTK